MAVNTQLVQDQSYRLFLFTLLSITCILVQMHLRPFMTVGLNQAELASHALLAIISSILQTSQPYPTSVQVVLLLLLLSPAFGLIAWAVHDQLTQPSVPLLDTAAKVHPSESDDQPALCTVPDESVHHPQHDVVELESSFDPPSRSQSAESTSRQIDSTQVEMTSL